MGCRSLEMVPRSPCAVCASEPPSLALAAACVSPLICEVMRAAMAYPAALSAAELICRPDDRRSIAVDNEFCELARLPCAISEFILVLIIEGILNLLFLVKRVRHCADHVGVPGFVP